MTVSHSRGSYEVSFCPLAEAISGLPADSVIITDSNVATHYRPAFTSDAKFVVIPPGESSKSVQTWSFLQSELVRLGMRRSTTIIAFGGGVIGDLAGFTAATYMRGVALIQMPTSLLAQVDSSVGGKVGIDLPEGKNLVGAFYPAQEVLICPETLATLPEREFRNGMAEVWKYALILDESMIGDLGSPNRDIDAIVRRCIELKKEVVEADEFETTGERAKLNFGHTVGHALEKLTGYGQVLHGEAISIGMVAEAAIGEAIGLTPRGTQAVVARSLSSEGLPTTSVVLRNVDALISIMKTDKKAVADGLAFSLLTGVGSCKLVSDVPESEVRSVLSSL